MKTDDSLPAVSGSKWWVWTCPDATGSWIAIQNATEPALIGAPDSARSAGSLASKRLRPAPEAVKVTP